MGKLVSPGLISDVRTPVLECSFSCVRGLRAYSTKWDSDTGETRFEEMGSFSWVSKVPTKHGRPYPLFVVKTSQMQRSKNLIAWTFSYCDKIISGFRCCSTFCARLNRKNTTVHVFLFKNIQHVEWPIISNIQVGKTNRSAVMALMYQQVSIDKLRLFVGQTSHQVFKVQLVRGFENQCKTQLLWTSTGTPTATHSCTHLLLLSVYNFGVNLQDVPSALEFWGARWYTLGSLCVCKTVDSRPHHRKYRSPIYCISYYCITIKS